MPQLEPLLTRAWGEVVAWPDMFNFFCELSPPSDGLATRMSPLSVTVGRRGFTTKRCWHRQTSQWRLTRE
jgi:hypothetical protein